MANPSKAALEPDHPLDQFLAQMSSTHRPWVLPLLRALDTLGGAASPADTEKRIRKLVQDRLSSGQWAYLLKNAHIRWARFGLKEAGMIGGPRGIWELTDKGRELLRQCGDREIEVPDLPELDEETYGDIDAPTQTVPATSFGGYTVPLLESLSAESPQKKKELYEALESRLSEQLLPGDYGIMRRGREVWKYRMSWALTYLKRDGLARNSAAGWEITPSGRSYLEAEKPSWKLSAFQDSKVEVRQGTGSGKPEAPTEEPDESSSGWTLEQWTSARLRIGGPIFDALQIRLRPNLGPTPTREGALLRNVILYGPPGTGKTHIARLAAQALTGQAEPGPESRWRLVQFHPSYAYEDFVQGLRPDLEEDKLRYKLHQGPFQQICSDANDDPDNFYVIVIDEINRGDPARIFGELLYALEYRGAAVDLPTGGQLNIPPNLIVIGTMNSVDRSVALVDYALRRRFGFIRVEPDVEVVRKVHKGKSGAGVAAEVLTALNAWLSEQLDPDHQIGHSYFLGADLDGDIRRDLDAIWQFDILPQLSEYFAGEPETLRQARVEWKGAVTKAIQASEEVEEGDATQMET